MNYRELNDNEILSYIENNDDEAIKIIYEKYKPLINKIATNLFIKYCKNTSLELSDLVQEGMIALNNAIHNYQESKDILFYTYAKTCIERKIISAVITARRQKQQLLNESISYEININEDGQKLEELIKDFTTNPENILIDMENSKELMEKIEDSLTPFELQVLQLKLDGFDYREIASIIDKQPKNIDNAIQRIKIKIKKILEEMKKN